MQCGIVYCLPHLAVVAVLLGRALARLADLVVAAARASCLLHRLLDVLLNLITDFDL